MSSRFEKFKTAIGAESAYNDFISEKNTFARTFWNILKVAAFRIFIETNSSESTTYEQTSQALNQTYSGWNFFKGVLTGHNILNSRLKKVLFGIGAIFSSILKIPEFIAYFFTLLLHTANHALTNRKSFIAQILQIVIIPLIVMVGLIRLVASVASPLSNGMRLIKSGYPKAARPVMILSTLSIGLTMTFTGVSAFLLSQTSMGAWILATTGILAAAPYLIPGILFAGMTIMLFNALTKIFSTGFSGEISRNAVLEAKLDQILKSKTSPDDAKNVAKTIVSSLIDYEKAHNKHFSLDTLDDSISKLEISEKDYLNDKQLADTVLSKLVNYSNENTFHKADRRDLYQILRKNSVSTSFSDKNDVSSSLSQSLSNSTPSAVKVEEDNVSDFYHFENQDLEDACSFVSSRPEEKDSLDSIYGDLDDDSDEEDFFEEFTEENISSKILDKDQSPANVLPQSSLLSSSGIFNQSSEKTKNPISSDKNNEVSPDSEILLDMG